jgi:hypothetical protein
MALKETVQRRSREVWNGRLQSIEAVIQRQEGVLAEGDAKGFLLGRQDRRARLLRPHRHILDGPPMAPL